MSKEVYGVVYPTTDWERIEMGNCLQATCPQCGEVKSWRQWGRSAFGCAPTDMGVHPQDISHFCRDCERENESVNQKLKENPYLLID
jgi:hypothetical protein